MFIGGAFPKTLASENPNKEQQQQQQQQLQKTAMRPKKSYNFCKALFRGIRNPIERKKNINNEQSNSAEMNASVLITI